MRLDGSCRQLPRSARLLREISMASTKILTAVAFAARCRRFCRFLPAAAGKTGIASLRTAKGVALKVRR